MLPNVNPPLQGQPLRLAVLGDFDGPHTRRWLRVFVDRGHEVHAISFYQPREDLPGVTLHVLRPGERQRSGEASTDRPAQALTQRAREMVDAIADRWLLRVVHALRYQNAGLRRTLQAIRPDVFHGHYVVEHGFYGAFAAFHPYVVSAWGSDLLVESYAAPNQYVARFALRRADLVTVNDQSMAMRAIELGVPSSRVAVVRLGVDASFLQGPPSVNLDPASGPPAVISDRALEPLYNIDIILRAFARVRERLPDARLLVAHDGSERAALEALAGELGLGDAVRFLGRLEPGVLRDALAGAHVYVSVPSSDSLSLSTREAMAAGAFPIVSDLPSQDGWIEHGVNGLRVPARNVERLAEAIEAALNDPELRRRAVEPNRARIESEDVLEQNMLAMEKLYYEVAKNRQPSSL